MAPLPMNPNEADRYAGFWIRAGSQVLDALIALPLVAINAYVLSSYRLGPLYMVLPLLAVNVFYSVYLVSRFGGTPGKLLMAIRITSLDGSPVTFGRALLREAPMLALGVISTAGRCIALLRVSDTDFYSRSWLERQRYVSEFAPGWVWVVAVIMQLWTWSELIVMLTNPRRRALHDFIAGTVVIKKEYAEPVPVSARG